MNLRRRLAIVLLAALALAVAGCTHRTATWAQPVPSADGGGTIEQPIWTNQR